MKYLLKQNKEDKGILCDKVTLNEFDYYVSDEFIEEGNFAINLNTKEIRQYDGVKGMDSYWKKIIATNNSNIDIPKVVDEVKQDGYREGVIYSSEYAKVIACQEGYIKGYNKSQETHPFSEEDVRWIFAKAIELSPSTESHTRMINDEQYRNHVLDSLYVKVLQLWKEQQPKILYYE